MSQQVYRLDIFDGTEGNGVLAPSASVTSRSFPVNSMRPMGNFAAQVEVSGNGSVDIDIETSINGEDFVATRNLFEDFGASDGPSSEGKSIESFGVAVFLWFRFVAKNKSEADSATVSLWIGVQ